MKRFEATVFFQGKFFVQKSFPTYAAAERFHDEQKELVRKNASSPTVVTVRQMIDGYRASEFAMLKKSSQQARESRFRYVLEADLAEVALRELNPDHLDKWISWLKHHPTNMDPNRFSFRQELKLLTTVLNWYRENHDATFVALILKRHRRQCLLDRKKDRVPDYFMKPEEIRQWFIELGKIETRSKTRLQSFSQVTTVLSR